MIDHSARKKHQSVLDTFQEKWNLSPDKMHVPQQHTSRLEESTRRHSL